MCLIHIKVQSIIHMTVEFHVFKCNHNALMKEARGQNKLFQNASLLMCYCSFAVGQFLTFKNQSEKQAIELLFKVQISPDHPSSKTNKLSFYVHNPFCELYSAFNGISHKKLFAVFLPKRWEFLSDYFITYSGQKSQQITD